MAKDRLNGGHATADESYDARFSPLIPKGCRWKMAELVTLAMAFLRSVLKQDIRAEKNIVISVGNLV